MSAGRAIARAPKAAGRDGPGPFGDRAFGPKPPPNSAPTARLATSCAELTCSFDAAASFDSDGTITDYAWQFGDGTGASGVTATHTYAEPGTYTAELIVTDDRGGSSRDPRPVSVKPNAAPTARLRVSCSGRACRLEGASSSDSDGTIGAYEWDFGDTNRAVGDITEHGYATTGTYTVTLTVTDDLGATDSAQRTIALISLSARPYKLYGRQKVALSWTGSSTASYDVVRDGARIATVQARQYTDNLGYSRSGSYRYKVCQTGSSICSNPVTVREL